LNLEILEGRPNKQTHRNTLRFGTNIKYWISKKA